MPGTPDAREEGQVPAGAKRDYGIILTRNLFGQHFEPEETPPAPAVEANLEKSDLEVVLVGTVGDSEGTHRAIILDKKSRKQDLYKEGDEVKGANIKEIQRGKVILEVEGREELLDMSEAASVRPVLKVPPEALLRQRPQAGVPPGLVQPEPAVEPSAPVTGEIAPGAEGVPEAMEETEPPVEAAPEAVAPEEGNSPEAAPDLAPEAPPEEQQASERRIVRPRVIRPYRSY